MMGKNVKAALGTLVFFAALAVLVTGLLHAPRITLGVVLAVVAVSVFGLIRAGLD